ncbi:hypothetical protein NP51_13650 [Lacticaseibacillus rhamnosus]|nr:hypothetical protein NP51_13650 [Lacticaseibacillus rhamnosus]
MIGLVTQTINDFYFVINVRNVSVSAESLLKGLIIGIFAAMLATLPPAIEAMRTVPASTFAALLPGKQDNQAHAVVVGGVVWFG